MKLVEVDKHDAASAVGKLDGLDVVVGGAAKLVGKKAKVRVERVLDGVAYATLLAGATPEAEPITFESEAEKPTRAPSRAKKTVEAEAEETEETDEEEIEEIEEPEPEAGEVELEDEADDEPEDEPGEAIDADAGAVPVKKKTRRGSRGGRNRKKKPAALTDGTGAEADEAGPAADGEPSPASPRIHVPDFELGETEKPPPRKRTPAKPKPAAEVDEEAAEQVAVAVADETDGAEPAPAKKKTRRGSRGGRNRKKPAAAAGGVAAGAAVVESENGAEPAGAPEAVADSAGNGAEPATDDYVPMSEWLEDLDA